MHRNTKENQLTSGLETSRRRLRLMKSSVRNSQMWKRIRWEKCPCWNERCSRETNRAACVHDAHEEPSNPDDHEIERFSEWTRDLQTISGRVVNRGRYRAMLMQLLQCPLTESRGHALEECECPVRQYEAQNVDKLGDTIKAAILARNPQDSEWCSDETAGV